MGRSPALIALLAACGNDRAAVDAAPRPEAGRDDADLIDFQVTGTYLDWDSTAAAPCPIGGATWTAHYDNTRVATTDANGAFTILLASYLVELDIQQPTAATACTAPQSHYELPAAAIMPPVLHYAGGHFVARAFTADRATTLYTAIGAPFDITRGQLLVHLDGEPRMVSISSPHAPEQAFDGTTWAAGATGTDVFFPNIDLVPSPMTTVTVAGGAVGIGSVKLTGGQIMFMTAIPN